METDAAELRAERAQRPAAAARGTWWPTTQLAERSGRGRRARHERLRRAHAGQRRPPRRSTSSATPRPAPASTPSTRSTCSSCAASAPTRRSSTPASPTARARGDCMFVGSVPEASVGGRRRRSSTARRSRARRSTARSTGRGSRCPTRSAPGDDPVRSIPPTGHVMGVYARIETDARHLEGAGRRRGAAARRARRRVPAVSDAEHTDLVKTGSVNGIRADPRRRHRASTPRARCRTDTRWLYVNVRLLFNYVKSACEQGLRWVRQEPNRDTLWTAVKFGIGDARSCSACGARARSAPASPTRSSPSSATRPTTRPTRSTRATSTSRSTSTRPSRPRRS